MINLNKPQTVAIVGADAIGQGMAAVAAVAGQETYLYDVDNYQLDPAYENIQIELNRQIKAGKLTEEERDTAMARIHITYDVRDVIADIVIENIQGPKLMKKKVIEELEKNNSHTSIIVSNSTNESITQLGAEMIHPNRFAGIHLFNPVPNISLVEVIAGEATSEETMALICQYAHLVGKTPIKVKDSPGFIVNRVARPFYLESLKVLEENVTDLETIDALMENIGFKEGPFKLMDYLGIDTNQKNTLTMFKAFGNEPRFRPSRIQQRKVDVGHLGMKTGKGFYDYEK